MERRRRRGGRIRCPKGRVSTEREREREKRELSVLVTYSFLCVPRHKQRRWKREGWGGWRGAVFAWPPSRVITRTSGVVGVQLSTLSAIRSCLTTDIAWSMAPSIARLGQNCLPPLHPLPPCTPTVHSVFLPTFHPRQEEEEEEEDRSGTVAPPGENRQSNRCPRTVHFVNKKSRHNRKKKRRDVSPRALPRSL